MQEKDIQFYLSQIKIEPDKLENECTAHSVLYSEFAIKLAMAKNKKDEKKDELSLLTAQKENQFRNSKPEEIGIPKITDKAIQALLDMCTDLVELKKSISELESDIRLLDAFVESMKQRGMMLNNLVSLKQVK